MTARNPEALLIVCGNVRQNVTLDSPELAMADIETVVTDYGPDVICLQEATVSERDGKHTGYLGQIATRHQMNVEFSQTRLFRLPSGVIHSGIATLTKPGISATTREIVLSEQRFSSPARPVGRRSLLITTIGNGERPLHIVNAHLSYPRLNRKARRREWRKLLDTVNSLIGDVVLAGDFNATPRSTLIGWFNKHWQALSNQRLPTWRNLRRLKIPRQRTIDYVFTKKDHQRQIDVRPLPHGSSDHTWHLISIRGGSADAQPMAASSKQTQ